MNVRHPKYKHIDGSLHCPYSSPPPSLTSKWLKRPNYSGKMSLIQCSSWAWSAPLIHCLWSGERLLWNPMVYTWIWL